MIRVATTADIEPIVRTYERFLTDPARDASQSNWGLGAYPTIEVPRHYVAAGTMFVLARAGEVVASMGLDSDQPVEYASVPWKVIAAPEEVLVIHTLCVAPEAAGQGLGTQMVEYAKARARELGCKAIRLDAYARNDPALGLYARQGFSVAGRGMMVEEGETYGEQVFLEYDVRR